MWGSFASMRRSIHGRVVSQKGDPVTNTFADFVLRLALGLAAALALVSSKWVTAGFYRIHCWILLGLNTLACLLIASSAGELIWPWRCALLGAIVSYVGSVVWLYERPRMGKLLVLCVLLCELAAAMALEDLRTSTTLEFWPRALDLLSSGLLLGWTVTAMLLGHWYLNTPGMQLRPLRQLVMGIGVAIAIRILVTGYFATLVPVPDSWGAWSAMGLRWLAGLLGLSVMVGLTWQTLQIPNTQSATGILYVAVVLVVIGELTSLLQDRWQIPPASRSAKADAVETCDLPDRS
jgi:hypothetical protein